MTIRKKKKLMNSRKKKKIENEPLELKPRLLKIKTFVKHKANSRYWTRIRHPQLLVLKLFIQNSLVVFCKI